MADADRNNLKTDHLEDNRNQRTRDARQPGASGSPAREISPEEARQEAEHRLGKTAKHSSSNRETGEAQGTDR